MQVLLVEDDAALGAALEEALRANGFVVEWSREGIGAFAIWQEHYADVALVVLDLGLPGQDGLTLLRQARKGGLDTPVLVLTARDEPHDRVTGLDAGADDYLVKPFHLDELLARCRAVLRRRSVEAVAEFAATDQAVAPTGLRVDERQRRAWWGGREVRLTASEFDLLALLVRHAGTVMSRDRLDAVLARNARTSGSNTLDVYVHRLRRKLDPGLIRTVHGIGYRLELDAADAPP